MAYTKSPWKLRQVLSGQLEIVTDTKSIASTSQATDVEGAKEVSANAYLIAAAPDMCEELKDILQFLVFAMPKEESGVLYREMARTEDRITTILSKAQPLTGEEK